MKSHTHGWVDLQALKDVLAGFLRTLPESCPVSSEDASRLGPVQRCLKREAIKCSKLLKQVRVELEECLEIASGTARPTVFMREMMRELQACRMYAACSSVMYACVYVFSWTMPFAT